MDDDSLRLQFFGKLARRNEIAAERHEQITGAERDRDAASQRAQIIRDGSARDVLVEALGHEPQEGLRGGLERIGLTPFKEPHLYQRLIEIYIDPKHQAAAEALRYAGPTTATMIRALDVLPSDLTHPNVLRRLERISEVHAFVEAATFAKSVNSRCTREARQFESRALQVVPGRVGTAGGVIECIANLVGQMTAPTLRQAVRGWRSFLVRHGAIWTAPEKVVIF